MDSSRALLWAAHSVGMGDAHWKQCALVQGDLVASDGVVLLGSSGDRRLLVLRARGSTPWPMDSLRAAAFRLWTGGLICASRPLHGRGHDRIVVARLATDWTRDGLFFQHRSRTDGRKPSSSKHARLYRDRAGVAWLGYLSRVAAPRAESGGTRNAAEPGANG